MTRGAALQAILILLLLSGGACAFGNVVDHDPIGSFDGGDAGVADGQGDVDAGDAGAHDAGEDAGTPDADGGDDADGGGDPCADPTICGAFGDNPLVHTGYCFPLDGGGHRCECARGFMKASAAGDAPCSIDYCDPPQQMCALGHCVREGPVTEGPDESWWPGEWYCDCPTGTAHEDEGNIYSRCRDVSECDLGTHDCSATEYCWNLNPGFECRCKVGYERDGNGDCVDIDECLVNNGNCATFATCENTEGGRICTCIEGREGNPEFECRDIDECGLPNPVCDPTNSYCVNDLPSLYHCNCFPGYQNSDRYTCVDIDECAERKIVCPDPNATCINDVGTGAHCECPSGWLQSGSTCIQSP